MTNTNNQNKFIKMNRIMVIITLILALLGSVNSFAGNTNDFINWARLHRDKVTREVSKNNNGFLDLKKISPQKKQKMNNYQ